MRQDKDLKRKTVISREAIALYTLTCVPISTTRSVGSWK
jgi:hypothetical protein